VPLYRHTASRMVACDLRFFTPNTKGPMEKNVLHLHVSNLALLSTNFSEDRARRFHTAQHTIRILSTVLYIVFSHRIADERYFCKSFVDFFPWYINILPRTELIRHISVWHHTQLTEFHVAVYVRRRDVVILHWLTLRYRAQFSLCSEPR
jgi:hypothetical protein